ncbi:iron chelate uptake ABC transporter family permease subunit [Paracoccus aminophilus]|uniref:ABC-type Fe3+-siderophore transport system, permease component n=1 Tax=Paracoccus aminophilus JCM 7686 TaxID=1367847 RepID=S5XLX8_PARAH|nr:iron chelate uptake ABC transporter family permease subunit [Paracoccus aminophilus]AGT08269.1 ABC-type Fe3+-siderophore transport system, permease component [Paracoccus aminophilus JCM 7686]
MIRLRDPGALWLLAGLGLVLLAALELRAGSGGLIGWSDLLALPQRPETLAQSLIETVKLPRLIAALAVGAALGMAGAVMQTLLRNPLAAPDILAVSNGALLMLAANTLLWHGLFPPLLATVLGGLAGGGISLLAGGGLRGGPLRLALAGVAVSLSLSALSTLLILLADDRASGLIAWSAGFLDQTGWGRLEATLPALVLAGAVILAMARTLDLYSLGAEVARNLGLSLLTVGVGLLAAIVLVGASVVLAGPIGFVGLAVPNIARLLGVTRHARLLPFSALGGAVLVVLADLLAQSLGRHGAALPTGALIGCLGAPILLLALRNLRLPDRESPAEPSGSGLHAAPLALWLALAAGASALAGLMLGDGLAISLPALAEVVPFRAPRIGVAFLAGGFLALAGVLLQTLSRNALAAPETLGLAQAAALGALAALFWGIAPGSPAFLPLVMAATLAAQGLALVFAGRTAARMTLVGLALATSFGSLSVLIVLSAQLQASEALHWLAGTVHGRSWSHLQAMLPWLGLGVAALCLAPMLDLLLLGDAKARALGLRLGALRAGAALIAALAVAVAVSTVGAIGFVGILGPHAARRLAGPRHLRLIPAAFVLGGIFTLWGDTIGRAIMPPYDLPAGAVTALAGGLAFLFIVRKRIG